MLSSLADEMEKLILTWVERPLPSPLAGHSSTDCRQAGLTVGGEERPDRSGNRLTGQWPPFAAGPVKDP